jgi:protein-tyrosine phosphatase
MARVLVVCTGNVCRSPIAEALLRAAFVDRMGSASPEVASAGTMGWTGSGADPHSIRAAAEHGIDISRHRARALDRADVASSSLILAMANEHVDTITSAVPSARSKTFTLKELVRLLEAIPRTEVDPSDPIVARVEAADELRRAGFGAYPHDEGIADPLGLSLEAFRLVADEIEVWSVRLADVLVGSPDARDAGSAVS